jgi:hypothetical protein
VWGVQVITIVEMKLLRSNVEEKEAVEKGEREQKHRHIAVKYFLRQSDEEKTRMRNLRTHFSKESLGYSFSKSRDLIEKDGAALKEKIHALVTEIREVEADAMQEITDKTQLIDTKNEEMVQADDGKWMTASFLAEKQKRAGDLRKLFGQWLRVTLEKRDFGMLWSAYMHTQACHLKGDDEWFEEVFRELEYCEKCKGFDGTVAYVPVQF